MSKKEFLNYPDSEADLEGQKDFYRRAILSI